MSHCCTRALATARFCSTWSKHTTNSIYPLVLTHFRSELKSVVTTCNRQEGQSVFIPISSTWGTKTYSLMIKPYAQFFLFYKKYHPSKKKFARHQYGTEYFQPLLLMHFMLHWNTHWHKNRIKKKKRRRIKIFFPCNYPR